jgi:predicted  nucleic acid-binding Zn-ribbon protein
MNDLLTNLLKLQDLDFANSAQKDAEVQKQELRSLIPPPILAHYDRLVARGKKGVALVRNQVCSGCHMRLPIGTVNTLMQGQDIQLCDTCGRYLGLAEPEATPKAEEPAIKAKPAPKPRKRRSLTNAGA